jgi:hypothetical protein
MHERGSLKRSKYQCFAKSFRRRRTQCIAMSEILSTETTVLSAGQPSWPGRSRYIRALEGQSLTLGVIRGGRNLGPDVSSLGWAGLGNTESTALVWTSGVHPFPSADSTLRPRRSFLNTGNWLLPLPWSRSCLLLHFSGVMCSVFSPILSGGFRRGSIVG